MSPGAWQWDRMAPSMSLTPGTIVFKNLPRMASRSPCGDSMGSLHRISLSQEFFLGTRGMPWTYKGMSSLPIPGTNGSLCFDSDGKYITQFGSAGLDPGQFDEPVGVAVGARWNCLCDRYLESTDPILYPQPGWNGLFPTATVGCQCLVRSIPG